MYVLHLAPFDPAYYPPLINTLHVSAAWGLESAIAASMPATITSPLGSAEVVSAPRALMRAELHRFLVTAAVQLIRRRGRPALVIGHNVYGLPAAALVSAFARAPLVYHCHDFHDLAAGPKIKRVLDFVERTTASLAKEIWVPAPERVAMATARQLRAPVRVVRNCPRRVHEQPLKGHLRRWLAAQGSRSGGAGKIITRHGRSGAPHLIREVIEALPALPGSVEFAIIGHGDETYLQACLRRARELGLEDRVFRHPFVPHDQLFQLLVDGDGASGIYGGGNDPNVASPAPNKVFENLAVGVPVLVPAGGSLEEDVVRGGAGVAVSIARLADELAPALTKLLEQPAMGARGRMLHLSDLNYERQLASTLLGRLRNRPACARVDSPTTTVRPL